MRSARLSRRDLLEKTIALGVVTVAAGLTPAAIAAAWDEAAPRPRTPENALGPFYKKHAPDTRMLRIAGDPGMPLAVSGRVFSTRGEALPEATVEPETFSGVPAFTVTPQAVPLTVDEEHFSVPMLSRELPTTVGTEPSVPSTPTTGGETVRLSTAGEVTNDVRTVTANEGETVRIPKASKPDGSRTVEK